MWCLRMHLEAMPMESYAFELPRSLHTRLREFDFTQYPKRGKYLLNSQEEALEHFYMVVANNLGSQ